MRSKIVITVLAAGRPTACNLQAGETLIQPTVGTRPTTDAPVSATHASTELSQSTIHPTDEPSQTERVSFSADILPLLDTRCRNCHGGEKIEKGLNLLSHA